jgi:hypothetical protein
MTISYNAEAYRLLEAIYELADGNPERVVASGKVAATSSPPPSERRLPRSGGS